MMQPLYENETFDLNFFFFFDRPRWKMRFDEHVKQNRKESQRR